eukprot:2655907-Amphidinium_carterae.1
MYGATARARSAWYETCQQQHRFLLASYVLLPSYSNMLLLACTVVVGHLQFHAVGMRMPLQVSLVTSLHLWFFQSAVRFHYRYVTPTRMRLPSKAGWGQNGGSKVYRWWLLLSVLALVQAEDASWNGCS